MGKVGLGQFCDVERIEDFWKIGGLGSRNLAGGLDFRAQSGGEAAAVNAGQREGQIVRVARGHGHPSFVMGCDDVFRMFLLCS